MNVEQLEPGSVVSFQPATNRWLAWFETSIASAPIRSEEVIGWAIYADYLNDDTGLRPTRIEAVVLWNLKELVTTTDYRARYEYLTGHRCRLLRLEPASPVETS